MERRRQSGRLTKQAALRGLPDAPPRNLEETRAPFNPRDGWNTSLGGDHPKGERHKAWAEQVERQ